MGLRGLGFGLSGLELEGSMWYPRLYLTWGL